MGMKLKDEKRKSSLTISQRAEERYSTQSLWSIVTVEVIVTQVLNIEKTYFNLKLC